MSGFKLQGAIQAVPWVGRNLLVKKKKQWRAHKVNGHKIAYAMKRGKKYEHNDQMMKVKFYYKFNRPKPYIRDEQN